MLFQDAATLWGIAAVILAIVEVLFCQGFFLSFSAAAVLMAAKVYFFGSGEVLHELTAFLALGVALILPFRWALRRFLDRQEDINEY